MTPGPFRGVRSTRSTERPLFDLVIFRTLTTPWRVVLGPVFSLLQISNIHTDERWLSLNYMTWTIDPPDPVVEPPVEDLNTDFKRDFPPDVFGHEADDTARVWKVYRAQATAHDDALLDGWNSTLDILLIFAGLFSAVSTAFLIESYTSLQFDKDGFVANALYALVLASNSTGEAFTLPTPPPIAGAPSLATRWLNGLWFTSLILALTVSLLSILVKQWLREYKARNNASAHSPRQWAQRHVFLHGALIAWRIAELISILPVLLHVALFLFLAGIILFLWDIDMAIGIAVSILSALLTLFYLISISISLWQPECPTATPLVGLIRSLNISTRIALLRTPSAVDRTLEAMKTALSLHCDRLRSVASRSHAWRYAVRWHSTIAEWTVSLGLWPRLSRCFRTRPFDGGELDSMPDPSTPRPRARPRFNTVSRLIRQFFNLRPPLPDTEDIEGARAFLTHFIHHVCAQLEKIQRLEQKLTDAVSIRSYVHSHGDDLDGLALHWIISNISDSDAVAVGLQAIGGLRPSSKAARLLRNDDKITFQDSHKYFTRSIGHPGDVDVARAVKAWLNLRKDLREFEFTSKIIGKGLSPYPDLYLLALAVHDSPPKDDVTEANESSPDYSPLRHSPTGTSTIMLLLRARRTWHMDLLQFCDFSSPAIDWDTILYATEVPPQAWAAVPERFDDAITGAARVCRALAAYYAPFAVDDEYQFPFHPQFGCVAKLMPLVSPDPAFLSNPRDISLRDTLHAYGSEVTDLVNFVVSSLFVPDDRCIAPIASKLPIRWAADFVHFRLALAVDRDDHVNMRFLFAAASTLLLRHKSWFRSERNFVHKAAAFIMTLPVQIPASNCSHILTSLLMPANPHLGEATVWSEIWLDTTQFNMFGVVQRVITWLLVLEQSSCPPRPDLHDAFLRVEDLPFLQAIIPNLDDTGRQAIFDLDLVALLDIAKGYQRLFPSSWRYQVDFITHVGEGDVRLVIRELDAAIREDRAVQFENCWPLLAWSRDNEERGSLE